MDAVVPLWTVSPPWASLLSEQFFSLQGRPWSCPLGPPGPLSHVVVCVECFIIIIIIGIFTTPQQFLKLRSDGGYNQGPMLVTQVSGVYCTEGNSYGIN